MSQIFEVGKFYRIIYDDKGFKVVKKDIKIILVENNILKCESKFGIEILNTFNIIRAQEIVENGEFNNTISE